MLRKWLRRALILLVLVAAAVALNQTVFRKQPVPVTVFRVAEGLVEDVVTTGRSTREVIDVLAGLGARVLALASMVNRSGSENPFAPLPYRALITADFPVWEPADCPLCRRGQPIERPGSRPIA